MEMPPAFDGAGKRLLSPDGRLALDFEPFPDPRTQLEATSFESMKLRDVATGALLGDFIPARYAWPALCGVALEVWGSTLVVAPDLQSFTSDADGDRSFPIAGLPAWQGRRFGQFRADYPDPPVWRAAWPDWLMFGGAVLVGLVLLALFFGDLRGRFAALLDDRPAPSAITGWVPDCPGAGFAPMHLDRDGRLQVPPAIAPAPLPPVAGAEAPARRFGDGRVMVEVDGTGVTWWPDGPAGRAVPCDTRAADRR